MQFLIGSLVTLAAVIAYSLFFKDRSTKLNIKLKHSQAYIHNIMAPALPILEILEKMKKQTQSGNHQKSLLVNVLVMDNEAYWIKENKVYSAQVVDDFIDNENAKVVDIMGMDDVELKRITFIIEKLTEGVENDRGNSSN